MISVRSVVLGALLFVSACGGSPSLPISPTPITPPGTSLPPGDAILPVPPGPTPPPATARRLRRTRFLAFGDSLTAGTTSPALTRLMAAGLPQSYPFKLQDLLKARYPGQSFTIDNEGKPGETAGDAVVRFPGVLRATAAEVVILLHGVNDITFLGQLGVARTAGFVNTMARDARFAGAEVMLCTLLPQRAGGFRATDPAVVASFNQAVRDIARGEGAILVDFATDFGDLGLIGADGVHPTEAGYARMAQMLADTIRAQFEVSPSQ